METDEILTQLGFTFSNGKVSKKLTDKYTLQKDTNKTEWCVDILLSNGGTDTISISKVRDDEINKMILTEIKAIERAVNEVSGEILDATFEEMDSEPVPIVTLPAPVGIGGIVRPAVTASEALAAWREFQQLKKCILSKSDIQRIQGKDFIVKSGWRKFATFYNLTDRIVEESKEDIPNGYLWKIKVVCTAPNGRQTEGVGICASTERKFSHPEHDIYSTAHTRSKNRAISDMIAAGEVSYEEVAAGGEI